MSISYRFVPDSRYYGQVVDRYYRQLPFALRLHVQFTMLLVPFVALWLYGLVTRAEWAGVAGVMLPFLAVAAFFGARLSKWGILRRLQGKADSGKEATVILSDEGIAASGLHTQGKWGWTSYPRAVRFGDGLLLLRPGVIRWLPDAALQSGTAEEATALVSAKTYLRRLP